jgi:hypothetical protein
MMAPLRGEDRAMGEGKYAVVEREEVVLGSCGEGKEMVKRRGEGSGCPVWF